ncbi:MAG: carbonic anhydrase [bacterium]|jgi:carbonic anhydrase|nr:carbonic anhydrase [Planctomycetota bacterium]HIL50875.1 carbonic anhydrase [Planctomycetota bacterium]
MTSATEALERLCAGNHRFVTGKSDRENLCSDSRRNSLVAQQEPFAVLIGCSDSRVPAEIVFDCGLGDLFVIRVAGNIVADSQVGSVEYAVEHLGTLLVVVLGHTGCGAVQATLAELAQPNERIFPALRFLIDSITPAVQPLVTGELRHDSAALEREAVRANIQASVANLRGSSEFLAQRLAAGELVIVGAEYSLTTGQVEFLADSGP